ncbi:MAG: CBS domain-containing protein [Planctomycetota bacterium]
MLDIHKTVSIKPGTLVRDVVAQMREAKLGAAFVVNHTDHPVGMFNERMLVDLLAHKPGAMDEPIEKHMTLNIVCMLRSDSVAKLIATMKNYNISWVCLVDEHYKPEALTGLRGVLRYVVEYIPHLIKVEPMDTTNLSMEQREGA